MSELTRDQQIHSIALRFAEVSLDIIPSHTEDSCFEKSLITFLDFYLSAVKTLEKHYDQAEAHVRATHENIGANQNTAYPAFHPL